MTERPAPLPPILLGGTINLFAAAPGTGKSTWLAWFSRQLQSRTPLWGHQWGHVPWQGIICADRSWTESTSRWFELEGMGTIPAYSLQDDRSFAKARLRHRHQRIAVFEHCLKQLSPEKNGKFPSGSLIYVDPLALFLGGNLLDYDTCLVACSELRELCMDREITVIGTAHSSKQRADKRDRYHRLQDRILGSTALFGYTDTQMFLAAPGEVDESIDHYVYLWHPHHAPPATFRFDRDKDGRFVPGTCIEGGTTIPEGPSEFPEWLQTVLNEPRTFLELVVLAADQLPPYSRATLNRRLAALKREGRVQQPKHGYWQAIKNA